jgi:hypothetical protein
MIHWLIVQDLIGSRENLKFAFISVHASSQKGISKDIK